MKPLDRSPGEKPGSRRAFLRGLLLVTTLLLASARYGNAIPRRRDVVLEWTCSATRFVAVDYLNDTETLPHALNVDSGVLPEGEALFRFYGVSASDAVSNYTDYYRSTPYHSRALKLTVRPAPGSRSVAGKVRLLNGSSGPMLGYTPTRAASVERTAILTFSFLCSPPLTSEFRLTIPAAR